MTERRPSNRPTPRNLADGEPRYPRHRTVVFAVRAPWLCVHYPSPRCSEQAPHPIEECGEFFPPRPGFDP
jgi:hypothetical protein